MESVEENRDSQTMTLRTTPLARTDFDSTLQEKLSDAMDDASQEDAQKPPPLRTILTKPVLISLANYAMLTFLDMGFLRSLIWSTPVQFGGLNFSPLSIGLWLAVYNSVDGFCQFALFPRLVARFGLRRVFITCVASFAVYVVMFPLENLVLRQDIGRQVTVIWPLIVLQLSAYTVLNMGFSESLLTIYSGC
jgi:MFS family permease